MRRLAYFPAEEVFARRLGTPDSRVVRRERRRRDVADFTTGRSARILHVHSITEAPVQKKLTITVDETIYDGLYRVVGPRRISQFIEDLVRPHVVEEDLSAAYAQMAADETREAEAIEWSNTLLPDVADEAR